MSAGGHVRPAAEEKRRSVSLDRLGRLRSGRLAICLDLLEGRTWRASSIWFDGPTYCHYLGLRCQRSEKDERKDSRSRISSAGCVVPRVWAKTTILLQILRLTAPAIRFFASFCRTKLLPSSNFVFHLSNSRRLFSCVGLSSAPVHVCCSWVALQPVTDRRDWKSRTE